MKVCERYSVPIEANGYQYDDAIQAGMLGLVIANQQYDTESAKKWSFMSVALMHIRREIQTLLFTDVKSKTLRNKEAPLSPEMVIELLGCRQDNGLLAVDVREFCDKLPLDPREKKFFSNIVEHGRREAGLMYMQETGMTRQGMGLRRRQVVNTAACLYDEVM